MADAGMDRLRSALLRDTTIDIVTRGARSGQLRTTEIWFTRIGSEIYICGTPSADGLPDTRSPRDWLANLRANPEFVFRLKESVDVSLDARAEIVAEDGERTRVFSAPETRWYRDQVGSVRELVDEAPLVKVTFPGLTPDLDLR